MIYPVVSFFPFLSTPLSISLFSLLSSSPLSQSTKNTACSSFILIAPLAYYVLKSLVSCLFLSSSFSFSYSLSCPRRKSVFPSSPLFLLVSIVFSIHPIYYPVDCKSFSSSRTSFFSPSSSSTFPSSSFSLSPASPPSSFLSSYPFPLLPSLFFPEIVSEASITQSPLLSRQTTSIIPFFSLSASAKDKPGKKERIVPPPRYRGLPLCCLLSLSSSSLPRRRHHLLAGSISSTHRHHPESRLSFSSAETGRWKEGAVENCLSEKRTFTSSSSSLSGSRSVFPSHQRRKKKNVFSASACMLSLRELSVSSTPLCDLSSSFPSAIHDLGGRTKPHLFLHPLFNHLSSSFLGSSPSSSPPSSPVSIFIQYTPSLPFSSSSSASSSSSLRLSRSSWQRQKICQTHNGKLPSNVVTISPSSLSSSSSSFSRISSSVRVSSCAILSSPFSRSSSTSLLSSYSSSVSSSSSSPLAPSSSSCHSTSISSKASPESRTFSLFSALLDTIDEDISSLSSAVTQVITAKRKSSSSPPSKSSRNDRSDISSGVRTPQLVSVSHQETRKAGDAKRESLTFYREQVNRLFLSLSGIAHSLLTFSSSLHSSKDRTSSSHHHHHQRISPLYLTSEEKKEKNNLPLLLNGLSVELKKVLHRLLSLDRYLTAAYRAEETRVVAPSTEGKRISSSAQEERRRRKKETEKRVADQGKEEEEKRREGGKEEVREEEEEKDVGGYIGVYVEYVAYMLEEISKKKGLLSRLHAQKGKGIETTISLSLIQDLEEYFRSLQKVRQPHSLELLFRKYWRVLQESYDLPSKETGKKSKEEEERGERSIGEGETQEEKNGDDRGERKEDEEGVREKEEERRDKEVLAAKDDRRILRDDRKEGQEEKEEKGKEEGQEETERQEKKSESSDHHFFQKLLRLVQEGRFLLRNYLHRQQLCFYQERKNDGENSDLNRPTYSNSSSSSLCNRDQERNECLPAHEVYLHPREKTFLSDLYDHDGGIRITSSTQSILSSSSKASTPFSPHKEAGAERLGGPFRSSDNPVKDEKEIFDRISVSCRSRGERDAFSWSLSSLRNRNEKLSLQDLLCPSPPLLPQELREIALSLFDSGVYTPQVENIVYQHLQPYTYQTFSTLHADRPLQQEPSFSVEDIVQPKTTSQDQEMKGKKKEEGEEIAKKQMRREDEEAAEDEEEEKRKKERHVSRSHTGDFDDEDHLANEEEEEEEILWSRLFLRKYAEEGQWHRALEKLRKLVKLVTPYIRDLSCRRNPSTTQVSEEEEERSSSVDKGTKKKIEDHREDREESRRGEASSDQGGALLLLDERKKDVEEVNSQEKKEEAKRYEVKDREELRNKRKDHEDDKDSKSENREAEKGRMSQDHRREILGLDRLYKDIALVMSVSVEKEQVRGEEEKEGNRSKGGRAKERDGTRQGDTDLLLPSFFLYNMNR